MPRSRKRRSRKRRPPVARHFKVDQELSAGHREVYFALLRQPPTTVDAAHAWLAEHGYTFSRSAVARHRRQYLTDHRRQIETTEALRHCADLSRPAAPGQPAPEVPFAAATLVEHHLFLELMQRNTTAFADEGEGGLGPINLEDLSYFADLVSLAVKTRRELIQLQQLQQAANDPNAPAPAPDRRNPAGRPPATADPSRTPEQREEALRRRIQNILGCPMPPADAGGKGAHTSG